MCYETCYEIGVIYGGGDVSSSVHDTIRRHQSRSLSCNATTGIRQTFLHVFHRQVNSETYSRGELKHDNFD